jgi:hypothetical protein
LENEWYKNCEEEFYYTLQQQRFSQKKIEMVFVGCELWAVGMLFVFVARSHNPQLRRKKVGQIV